MSVQEVLNVLNIHTKKFDSITTGQTKIEEKIENFENVLSTQKDDIVKNKNDIEDNKKEIDSLKILVRNLETSLS